MSFLAEYFYDGGYITEERDWPVLHELIAAGYIEVQPMRRMPFQTTVYYSATKLGLALLSLMPRE